VNIYEQEINYALEHLATKVTNGVSLAEADILGLAQLVDTRTTLLVQLRDQVIASENAIQSLISDLESADLAIDDMDDFIGTLRHKFESRY